MFFTFVSSGLGAQVRKPGPEVINLFSCSTQLSMKFFLLINVKVPTIVGILIFMSGKNNILGLSEPKNGRIYSWKFRISCSEHEKSFITSGPGSAYRKPVIFPGISGFRPALLHDRLDESKLFLKRPLIKSISICTWCIRIEIKILVSLSLLFRARYS